MNQHTLFSKQYMYGCLLIFTLALMAGCRAEGQPLVQEEMVDEITPLTMTPLSTQTPLPPISTSTPTATKLPTITPSATPTTIFTVTPTTTPVPTITAVEREALFENFMVTNGGCEIPCWWGVELGTSLENISQEFISLGLPSLRIENSYKVDSDQMGMRSAGYADRYVDEQHRTVAQYRLDVDMEFHELDGSVEYIYVDVDRIRFEQSQQEFIRDWEQYYLSSFLQKYGKPDQVYFRIRSVGDLMLIPQYSLSLLYREQGLAITYHIEGEWLDEAYTQAEVCLDIENVRSLELSLFNPDGFDTWGYQFAPYHDELYEPLTWDAGMVYEIYQHPENLNCLIVP